MRTEDEGRPDEPEELTLTEAIDAAREAQRVLIAAEDRAEAARVEAIEASKSLLAARDAYYDAQRRVLTVAELGDVTRQRGL